MHSLDQVDPERPNDISKSYPILAPSKTFDEILKIEDFQICEDDLFDSYTDSNEIVFKFGLENGMIEIYEISLCQLLDEDAWKDRAEIIFRFAKYYTDEQCEYEGSEYKGDNPLSASRPHDVYLYPDYYIYDSLDMELDTRDKIVIKDDDTDCIKEKYHHFSYEQPSLESVRIFIFNLQQKRLRFIEEKMEKLSKLQHNHKRIYDKLFDK